MFEFWFEMASNYSFLSAMRIEAAANAAGVAVIWRPFLLGPIFKAQGLTTSPFVLHPVKSRHMVRDMKRITEDRGLSFELPDPFPVNGLAAARIALAGCGEDWGPVFVKAVYLAEFTRGKDIADEQVLAGILKEIGVDAANIMARASSAESKLALRKQTERAVALNIFGAPSFITSDGELFWGDDRLEQALQWEKSRVT